MSKVSDFTKECDGKCQMCGSEEELRPYGPGGKWVCFDCGMKDEEEAIKQFAKQFENDGCVITGDTNGLDRPK